MPHIDRNLARFGAKVRRAYREELQPPPRDRPAPPWRLIAGAAVLTAVGFAYTNVIPEGWKMDAVILIAVVLLLVIVGRKVLKNVRSG